MLSTCERYHANVDDDHGHGHDDPSGLRIVYVFLRDTRLWM